MRLRKIASGVYHVVGTNWHIKLSDFGEYSEWEPLYYQPEFDRWTKPLYPAKTRAEALKMIETELEKDRQ